MTEALIVVAMDDEAEPFRRRAQWAGTTRRLGHAEHTDLVLSDRKVRLIRSGIGLVNATAAVAVALQETGPLPVISAGSAGGLAPDVRVGDVVVGTEFRFHGVDATAFGYERGQVPGMPAAYAADPGLLKAAHIALDTARQGDEPVLSDGTVRLGTMVSGDSFVTTSNVEAVRAAFPGALSTDMETTAIAQTCLLAGAAFISVRGISDLCGPAAESDFRTHVDDAGERSASLVERFVTELTRL